MRKQMRGINYFKNNYKKMKIPKLLMALIIAGVMASGCAQKSDGVSPDKEGASKTGTASECAAGTTKTVVGKEYVRTGTETHTIQGTSMDLCCWEFENSYKTKNKICCDSATSPVGYSNGILWETARNASELTKTMERYQKDGKSCQQFFDAKGNMETEHCE